MVALTRLRPETLRITGFRVPFCVTQRCIRSTLHHKANGPFYITHGAVGWVSWTLALAVAAVVPGVAIAVWRAIALSVAAVAPGVAREVRAALVEEGQS